MAARMLQRDRHFKKETASTTIRKTITSWMYDKNNSRENSNLAYSDVVQEYYKNKKNGGNTYQMEPSVKPCLGKIGEMLEDVIWANTENYTFHTDTVNAKVLNINNSVHRRLRLLIPERYRFIVQTHLFTDNSQGITGRSRFVWNPETDNIAERTIRVKNLIANVTCFFIYTE